MSLRSTPVRVSSIVGDVERPVARYRVGLCNKQRRSEHFDSRQLSWCLGVWRTTQEDGVSRATNVGKVCLKEKQACTAAPNPEGGVSTSRQVLCSVDWKELWSWGWSSCPQMATASPTPLLRAPPADSDAASSKSPPSHSGTLPGLPATHNMSGWF